MMLNSLGAWCFAWLMGNQVVAICTQEAGRSSGCFQGGLKCCLARDAGFFEKWNIVSLKLVQWITVINTNNFLCITPIMELTFECVSYPPLINTFSPKIFSNEQTNYILSNEFRNHAEWTDTVHSALLVKRHMKCLLMSSSFYGSEDRYVTIF